MEFRIAQISDDPSGVLTGAFVFSPPPHLPEIPRVLLERFGAENTRLGLHGWAVDSKGLRPRLIEKRGAELWLCFGAEVSFHVPPGTPVRITVPGSDVEGTEIWPPIPRGKAPPLPPGEDDEWPALAPPKPEPKPQPKPEPKPEPAPPPPPAEEPTIIRPPAPVEPPPPPQPPPPPPPPPGPGTDTGGRSRTIAILAAILLLLAGGGAAWWFLNPSDPPVQEAAAPAPAPERVPEPPPPPANPDCAEAADVLSGKCTPDMLRGLPPADQTRLAEALLRNGEARAGNVAVSLLSVAASGHNHAQARLALGRLYDPATFKPGGPLSAANPGRALDEFGKAAEAGLAEARTARDALVARLRQEATGTDPAAADRARAALAAAGIQ